MAGRWRNADRRASISGMDKWRNGVVVARAAALAGKGRATAFDFAGTGGEKTWIGTVTMHPGANTGPHHHQRHEVTIYVVKGGSEIRWGERLEFVAEIGPGDFVYFAPYVPHQERNLSDRETVDFVVVRSGNEGFVTKLDAAPVERPEAVF
jgi:uncharacterized RmlC-like cupin family protein